MNPTEQMTSMDVLAFVAGLIVAIIIGLLGLIILWRMVDGTIKLEKLISEPDGSGASLSRFQFLIFTFVIAMSLLLIVIANQEFPKEISPDVIALLGISSASYVISKSIHPKKDEKKKEDGDDSSKDKQTEDEGSDES